MNLLLKNADGTAPADTGALSPAVKAGFDQIMHAFTAFRETSERKSQDYLTKAEAARIDATIQELKENINRELAAARRSGLEAKGGLPEAAQTYRKSLDTYLRKGEARLSVAQLKEQEMAAFTALDGVKAMAVNSEPDGGFMVMPSIETQIDQTIREFSPMRQVARVVTIGTDRYRKPVNIHGTNSGWVGEKTARPETSTSQLSMLEIPVQEMYANPSATQTMLDDGAFNVEQFIADEVAIEFAVQEGIAFINGDGVSKPRGLLDYGALDDSGSGVAWGSVGQVKTGVSADWPTSGPADILIDLIYRLKEGYRGGARFMMNRQVLADIRKFKDGQGNYLAGPALQDGSLVENIFGFPVSEAVDMPAKAAGSRSVAFGDFQRAYLIVDRVGIRVLRDPYTSKPNVFFYTTKRVGGGIANFEAVKFLTFSA